MGRFIRNWIARQYQFDLQPIRDGRSGRDCRVETPLLRDRTRHVGAATLLDAADVLHHGAERCSARDYEGRLKLDDTLLRMHAEFEQRKEHLRKELIVRHQSTRTTCCACGLTVVALWGKLLQWIKAQRAGPRRSGRRTARELGLPLHRP